jgi:hypothetical protein
VKRSPLHRRSVLRRRTPLRRTASRRSAPRPTVPDEVRAELAKRSEGLCEIRIAWKSTCTGAASDVHHRVVRGMGGCRSEEARWKADRLSGLLHGCRGCHAWVHANPEAAGTSGLILPRGSDSSSEPVWRRGVLVYLDDLGQVHDYEAGAA